MEWKWNFWEKGGLLSEKAKSLKNISFENSSYEEN